MEQIVNMCGTSLTVSPKLHKHKHVLSFDCKQIVIGLIVRLFVFLFIILQLTVLMEKRGQRTESFKVHISYLVCGRHKQAKNLQLLWDLKPVL